MIDEAGGHAVVVGATIRALQERPDGTLDPAEIVAAFRDPSDLHEPITGLVILENTNAHTGGRPLTVEYTRTVAAIAHERGVPLHIDGARFFNAVVALGVTPAELAAPADSVTFCLSKGLSAPIGSVVVGNGPFVARARRARKLLGGGMRQVGRARGGGAGRPSRRRRRHDRRGSPRITRTPGGWPRASRASTASARRAGSPSRATGRARSRRAP